MNILRALPGIVIWDILPVVAVFSINKSHFLDDRYRNLLAGTVLATSGANLSIKSAALMMKGEKKVVCLTLAALGVSATVVGIIQIAVGVFGLVTPQKKSYPVCEERVEWAKKEILKCPYAANLWEKVQNKEQGGFDIVCDGEVTDVPLIWKHSPPRVLRLSHSIESDRAVSAITMGVCSFNWSQDTLDLEHRGCSLPPVSYAVEKVKIEYRGFIDYYKICQKCLTEGYWPNQWIENAESMTKEIEDNEKTLNWYLNDQRKQGQMDAYESLWRRQCLPTREAITTPSISFPVKNPNYSRNEL